MNKAKKISLWAAVALIGGGILLLLAAVLAVKGDFTRFNTVQFTAASHEVEEPFDNIRIDGAECDILFALSEDGTGRVECMDAENVNTAVSVEDGTLTVKRIDNRAWYDCLGVSWGPQAIVVYLPLRDYQSLFVRTASGNVEIGAPFRFSEAELNSSSGILSFSAFVEHTLTVQTSSGNILVQNVVADQIQGTSVSGNMELTGCDAGMLTLETVSGNIRGTLLQGKEFSVETASGTVAVPPSSQGGICTVKTASGNIRISVE